MEYIVDRIENGFVVVEIPNKSLVGIPIEFFQEEINEGDIIEVNVLHDKTKEREKEMKDKYGHLWK